MNDRTVVLMAQHGIQLCSPVMDDCEAFLSAVKKSQKIHHPWVYPPDTERQFSDYVRQFEEASHQGFFIRQDGASSLCGVINLNEIVRGCLQSAYMGFYAFKGFQQKGIMKKALQLVIQYAFHHLDLHRIEANVNPKNTRSVHFVESAGFQREGFSPKYLKINGIWEDHCRYALINDI